MFYLQVITRNASTGTLGWLFCSQHLEHFSLITLEASDISSLGLAGATLKEQQTTLCINHVTFTLQLLTAVRFFCVRCCSHLQFEWMKTWVLLCNIVVQCSGDVLYGEMCKIFTISKQKRRFDNGNVLLVV